MSEEHPNARLVREFHRHQHAFYGGGPIEPVAELLAEDVRWHVPGESAISGEYAGRDAVLGYFRKRRDHARASMRIKVHEVLANDRVVVILAGGEAELGGRTSGWETVGVFRVAGGELVEGRLIPFDQASFDEIWS